MYPAIFGFIDSYSVMMILGVIACALLVDFFFKRKGKERNFILDFDIMIVIAVLVGIVFACLFQNLYNFIEDPENYTFTTSITFLGGLIGGIISFIVSYNVYFKKRYSIDFKEVLKIAPAGITIAHGFGRIGCFLAGCCYGKVSDSIFAMKFPGMAEKVLPTQLFEAIFLFLLAGIFTFLAFKFDYKYSMCFYLVAYGLFRFFMEFLRGDDRGAFLFNISPSQFWCIVMVIAAVPVFLYIRGIIKYEKR